ncbi:MAG: hypothetical protein A2Y62_02100 [Candidatus Fischerbacteria bacterium RBG_13_37_8]|uniref:Uncharacterized protein n=1 Tax=Candidatus Fischerbacteria bacterium RBG_13_37_8 TaxID=1817863 RepID=A0A1F5VJZ7_9BACT|nr:MAG: hypothetical protein A2Y62_02100 [Candidatus Fischerbacteria bacterium RBG_13_37_8]
MRNIPKKYIVDENNNKIAVQIDIKTFAKLEKILTEYASNPLRIAAAHCFAKLAMTVCTGFTSFASFNTIIVVPTCF